MSIYRRATPTPRRAVEQPLQTKNTKSARAAGCCVDRLTTDERRFWRIVYLFTLAETGDHHAAYQMAVKSTGRTRTW